MADRADDTEQQRPATVGALLIAARKTAGLRQQDVAAATSVTQPKLSRIECGEAYPVVSPARDVDDVAELAELYRLDDADREWIYDVLDRRDERRYTVVQGRDVLAVQRRFRRLATLASRVRAFSTNGVIVGELQTPRMAAAVFGTGVGSPQVAERRLRHVGHPDNAHRRYDVVLHESVVGWRTVPADVLAEQVDDLVEASRLPNVDLRWIPSTTVLAAPRVPALSIYEVPTTSGLQVTAILGQLDGAATRDEEWAVERYVSEFERLRSAGLAGDVARDRMQRVATVLRRPDA